jgi:uncharacterized protein YlxP (DUF503 family)
LIVGTCTVSFHIPGSGSLKSKRLVLKSLKDRIRQRFNVSVAEVDHWDLWQRSTLGVAVVSRDGRFADSVIAKVLDLLEAEADISIIDIQTDQR